jgi:hypothetical protein
MVERLRFPVVFMLNTYKIIIVLVLVEGSRRVEEVSGEVIITAEALTEVLVVLSHLSIEGVLLGGGLSLPIVVSGSLVSSWLFRLFVSALRLILLLSLFLLVQVVLLLLLLLLLLISSLLSSVLVSQSSLLLSISFSLLPLLLLILPLLLGLFSLVILVSQFCHDLFQKMGNIFKSLKNLRVSEDTIDGLGFVVDALSADVLHDSFDQILVILKILDDMGIGDDVFGDGSLLVIRMDMDV